MTCPYLYPLPGDTDYDPDDSYNPQHTIACGFCGAEVCHVRDSEGNFFCSNDHLDAYYGGLIP